MSKGLSDADYLNAVRDHQPAATTEVADAVGVARQSAGYRLKKLEEEGRVESKKVGPSRVWMLMEENQWRN